MATIGQQYGNARNIFEEAVTVINEQFSLMVIDDRWELWEAITVKLKEKEVKYKEHQMKRHYIYCTNWIKTLPMIFHKYQYYSKSEYHRIHLFWNKY